MGCACKGRPMTQGAEHIPEMLLCTRDKVDRFCMDAHAAGSTPAPITQPRTLEISMLTAMVIKRTVRE